MSDENPNGAPIRPAQAKARRNRMHIVYDWHHKRSAEWKDRKVENRERRQIKK